MQRLTPAFVRELVKAWPQDMRDDFEERAAIMEFCGGLFRIKAEELAYYEIKDGPNLRGYLPERLRKKEQT